MIKTILSLLIVTAFTCQRIETSDIDWFVRCENDEVICYFAKEFNAGGLSCKFKDQIADVSIKVGGK